MRVKQHTLAWALLAVLVLAACSPAPTAAPTAAPTTAPATEEPTPAPLSSVNVSDQDASQGSVIIDEITAAEQGWIVIHLNVDGGPGPVIGYSAVQPGANLAVPVEIDLASATPELFAMLHVDRGAMGQYEFPGEDVPAMAGEVMVNVPFSVTLPAMEPSVTASDQSAVNGTVTIDQVVAAQAGWIVIHIDSNGAPGPVIGFAPVAAGANPDVAVEIDLAQATPTLHAMLHLDAGTLGTYEFPGDDGPVRAGDAVVMVPFQLLEPQASGSEVAVSIVSGAFRDKQISVPVGTTVVWTNTASGSHTVTADDGSFSSGTLGPGGTFSFTFTAAGTFPYYCGFHGGPNGAGMSGVVTVTP
jgi:plastocyanin